MNVENLLLKLMKLRNEIVNLRQDHAQSLVTNKNLTIEDVRYSQGYVNSLDWLLTNLDGYLRSANEEEEDAE